MNYVFFPTLISVTINGGYVLRPSYSSSYAIALNIDKSIGPVTYTFIHL
jgi:hypothetical protein